MIFNFEDVQPQYSVLLSFGLEVPFMFNILEFKIMGVKLYWIFILFLMHKGLLI